MKTAISEKNILGEYGYFSTKLDFKKYWTTVLDDITTTDVDDYNLFPNPFFRSFF